MMRWIAFLLLLAGLLVAAACGDGDGTPAATPTPTETATAPATATPVPSPTPLGGMVPEGWERHTTADFQIDLPETWEASAVTEESLEEIVETARSGGADAEFVSMLEQLLPEEFEFFGFDSESGDVRNTVNIVREEFPFAVTIPEILELTAADYVDLGATVLASNSALTIGGLSAGRIDASSTLGLVRARFLQYVVLVEPNLVFGLTLGTSSTTSDDFSALEPLFEQIAQSFRVLGSP